MNNDISIKVKKIREEAMKKLQYGGQPNFNTFQPDQNPTTEVNLGSYFNQQRPQVQSVVPEGFNPFGVDMGTPLQPEATSIDNTQLNPANVDVQTRNIQNLYNPYTGINLESALFSLGQSLNYKGENKGANTLLGAASAGKVLFGGARTLLSGAGYQNRSQDSYNDYRNKLYNPDQIYTQYQQGGEVTNAQVLTGAYLPETPNPSVEIEKNEMVKDGETGDIQKAVGETHEQGGIPVNLPNLSKVLSDHTKIGAVNAKLFRDDLDIKVKATDTYAKVLDKYNKKIGWDTLIEEEEKAIEKVGDQETGEVATTTKDINMNYLSDKLQDLQAGKEAIKPLQDEAFEKIFAKQEAEKRGKGADVKMQEGGQYDENIIALAQQYNLTPERVAELLKASAPQQQSNPIAEALAQGAAPEEIIQQLVQSGMPEEEAKQMVQSLAQQPQMQNGGLLKLQDGALVNYYTPSQYTLADYQNQPFGETNFIAGNVSDLATAQQRLLQQSSILPNTLRRSGLIGDNNQVFLDSPQAIGAFQTNYNEYINNTLPLVDSNPNIPAEQKQAMKDRLAQEMFTGDTGNVRSIDNTLGNFTISRGSVNLPYLTETDRLKYPKVKRIGDILDETGTVKPGFEDLTPETLAALQGAVKTAGINALDVGLLDIPVADTSIEASLERQTITNTQNTLGFANLPVDFNLPPNPLQDVFKASASLSRIDPLKISPEANLIEADRQRQAATTSTAFLPDSQRAAVIASLLGQTQQATNAAISQAETVNAQGQYQADVFNAQQSDKQQLLDNQFNATYEQNAFAAQNNSDVDLRRYFNSLNDQQWFNYNYVDRRNAFNQAPMQYTIDGQFKGNTGNFTNPVNNSQFTARTKKEEEAFRISQAREAGKQAGRKK